MGSEGQVFIIENTHFSFLFLKIVRKFLRDNLLRIRKVIILIFVSAQKHKQLSFDSTTPSMFLIFFFDKERNFLKDKGQKKDKSNFSALEERAEVWNFR